MPILFTFFLVLGTLLSSPDVTPDTPKPVAVEKGFCKIYGAVYLEYDPKYKNTASYTVFLNEEEAYASMVVFKEKNKLFADNTGIWYITPKKAFADHILFVTDKRNFADFTVHFTTMRSQAACRE